MMDKTHHNQPLHSQNQTLLRFNIAQTPPHQMHVFLYKYVFNKLTSHKNMLLSFVTGENCTWKTHSHATNNEKLLFRQAFLKDLIYESCIYFDFF